ncbi:MAG TPA: HAMP domain-containing sensor histidine kinase, partial [Caldilineaceae bacterium]|nr:HAMP domain-containing sensor histidine kinase [Caldilineaceae bacterium]
WVEISDKEVVVNAIAEQFSRTPPRQLLDIPLRVGTETIGIITVDRAVRDPATRQLLTAMADLAGSAIQKTQALADSRQRAVELMETYERLQVMDRQRDEFIQNITHDLKAPLTFIRGYAELMAESALGEITAEQGEALGIIQERTDAINRLIGDILTLKQVESQPLQQIVFNLDAIARKSARNARMSARLAGLEIAVLSKKKQALVKGDMARMEQVFENLLSNAIKYSPDGGEIRLLVKVEADKIWVSVSDQGIGIAPEEIENIWSRYYRVPGVSAGGSGLGLANVRRVIEAHGGRISVQSEGKGTTFTFQLPRHQE